jgi:hypothetical protein
MQLNVTGLGVNCSVCATVPLKLKVLPIEVRVVRYFFKKKLNMPSLILAYFGTNEHPIYKNYKGDL